MICFKVVQPMENISIFNSWKTVFWSFRKKLFDSLSSTYRNWTTFFKSLFYLLKRISWPWILLHFWVASQHLSIFLTIALIFPDEISWSLQSFICRTNNPQVISTQFRFPLYWILMKNKTFFCGDLNEAVSTIQFY